MKEIEITLELTFRMAKKIPVTETNYDALLGGKDDRVENKLVSEIMKELETHIKKDHNSYYDREFDYAITDAETHEEIIGWA